MSQVLPLRMGRKVLWRTEMPILFIDTQAINRSDAPTNLDIGFIFISELHKKLNMRLPLLFCPWTPGASRIHTSLHLQASTPIPAVLCGV